MSRGPFQTPVYQASMRWPEGPCQKTSWVLPSLVTATPGVDERVPSWGKPTGPFQTPVYQASASWLVLVSFQKTSWVEPSGVTATCGAPTLSGWNDGGGGGDVVVKVYVSADDTVGLVPLFWAVMVSMPPFGSVAGAV